MPDTPLLDRTLRTIIRKELDPVRKHLSDRFDWLEEQMEWLDQKLEERRLPRSTDPSGAIRSE